MYHTQFHICSSNMYFCTCDLLNGYSSFNQLEQQSTGKWFRVKSTWSVESDVVATDSPMFSWSCVGAFVHEKRELQSLFMRPPTGSTHATCATKRCLTWLACDQSDYHCYCCYCCLGYSVLIFFVFLYPRTWRMCVKWWLRLHSNQFVDKLQKAWVQQIVLKTTKETPNLWPFVISLMDNRRNLLVSSLLLVLEICHSSFKSFPHYSFYSLSLPLPS